MPVYKHLIFLVFFLTLNVVNAQDYHQNLPELTNEDFGFKHPMLEATKVYYQSDESGYKPTMLEYHRFNKEQKIELRVLRIFGKYKSETVNRYVYEDGLLDSMNVTASSASFSSFTHYTYNNKKQLISSDCTGKYTNYTDTFSYDKYNRIESITRNHKNGNKQTTNFFYSNNQLDHVEKLADGKTTLFYFVDGALKASGAMGESKVMLYENDFGELTRQVVGDIAQIAKIYRIESLPGNKPKEKPFLKDAKILFQAHDTQNMDGDWIKRYQIDKQYGQNKTNFVFRELKYANNTTSGATKFDALYEMQIKKKFNLE